MKSNMYLKKNRAAAGTLTSRGHNRKWDVPSQTLPTGVPPQVYLTAISFRHPDDQPVIWMTKITVIFIRMMVRPSLG